MAARVNRTEKLDLRLTAQAKRTLQTAAAATHKTLSDFVLESALVRADTVPADRGGRKHASVAAPDGLSAPQHFPGPGCT